MAWSGIGRAGEHLRGSGGGGACMVYRAYEPGRRAAEQAWGGGRRGFGIRGRVGGRDAHLVNVHIERHKVERGRRRRRPPGPCRDPGPGPGPGRWRALALGEDDCLAALRVVDLDPRVARLARTARKHFGGRLAARAEVRVEPAGMEAREPGIRPRAVRAARAAGARGRVGKEHIALGRRRLAGKGRPRLAGLQSKNGGAC
jgi:hypothetical protein